MITKLHRAILLFALVLSPVAVHAGELTITFIGNQAFHITDGETTLLSDYPYISGAFGYMEYDEKDVPEIKDGLHLITHFHTDHWVARLFSAMEQKTKIIAPPGITKRLDPDRVIPFTPTEPMTHKDITVQPIEMPHALAKEHFSYLVTWHGKRLYFMGDTETPADILKQKDLDVLFITPWIVRTIERQNLTVDAKQLILYHHKTDEEVVPFQNYLRMNQNTTYTLEFEEE